MYHATTNLDSLAVFRLNDLDKYLDYYVVLPECQDYSYSYYREDFRFLNPV